jgi:hypothetical protein
VYSIFNANNNYHYITTSFTKQPRATFACCDSGWFIHKCKWPYLEGNVLIFAQMAHGQWWEKQTSFSHTKTAAPAHTNSHCTTHCNVLAVKIHLLYYFYAASVFGMDFLSAADLGAL